MDTLSVAGLLAVLVLTSSVQAGKSLIDSDPS